MCWFHRFTYITYLFLLALPAFALSFMPVNIQRVTCSNKEPIVLRQGVAELFKLYFDELFELGCDLGFQGMDFSCISISFGIL